MEWEISVISKAFNCSLAEAERTNMDLARNIMAMRAYDDVCSREERGDKLSEDDYKLILLMERAAGIRED